LTLTFFVDRLGVFFFSLSPLPFAAAGSPRRPKEKGRRKKACLVFSFFISTFANHPENGHVVAVVLNLCGSVLPFVVVVIAAVLLQLLLRVPKCVAAAAAATFIDRETQRSEEGWCPKQQQQAEPNGNRAVYVFFAPLLFVPAY